MINEDVDIAVIGGGPAGLAAAISAKDHGANTVILLDRNSWLGGILPQCIHDGFGVEEIGKSLTGPEYAEMYVDMCKERGIKFLKETMVLEFNENHEIIAVNKIGFYKVKAKAIVLAMGCREKTRWNVMIPGDRPSGIYTAGVTQALINLYNIIPGNNIIILGSGDVGLIMARRLKLEGANVLGVVEILPHASGLPRNVIQCLDDYDIPLYLNHTISYIKGRERLESVTIAQIDKKLNIIPGTEEEISCDTLLLSLGLIPENELSKRAGIAIDEATGGPLVDQHFETNIPGVYVCGNCLQVYDTVDVLSLGAKRAGKYAAMYIYGNESEKTNAISVKPGDGITYVIPQCITKSGIIDFTFRVFRKRRSVVFHLKSDTKEVYRKKLPWVNPANMMQISVKIPDEIFNSKTNLVVSLDD
jgi:NADPH-dependent 2,4-dienoyl-CoA reductase/sulfur reductase-like enzyme